MDRNFNLRFFGLRPQNDSQQQKCHSEGNEESNNLRVKNEVGFKIVNLQSSIFNSSGFTLLELLISMTIGLVVLGSVFSSFTTQKKSYELQEQITVMEQNIRVPLDFITRDLRNAGYNPTEDLTTGTSVGLVPGTDSGVTTTININSIRMLSNLDGAGADDIIGTVDDNSDTTGTNETVRYSFTGEDSDGDGVLDGGEDTDGDGILDAGDIQRNGQPLVQNITALTFTYYDSDGNTIATPITGTSLANIRVVQVSITARTEREDLTFMSGSDIDGDPNNGTCRTRTITAKVRTRNIGLQQTY